MTCAKCHYDWCWLCRGKYYHGHFDPLNPFGCPGGQYGTENACLNILKKIAMIIFMPLGLFFLAMGYTMAYFCDCCWNHRSPLKKNCLCSIIVFLTTVLPISLIAGALASIISPFAMLFQLYLLLKIFCKLAGQYCGCLCCCCSCCC